MSRLQTEQRRLEHRGREFHFVSFEGVPADPKRGREAIAPAWWLMNAGRRWEVMPFRSDQSETAIVRGLIAWLDTHVFGSLHDHGG